MATASGVCPRCSASITENVEVCAEHDASDGVCTACTNRYAVSVVFRCPNCIYERGGMFGVTLLTNTDLLAFLTAHGINPITPSSHSAIGAALDYDEEILSEEPFEAQFTFTQGGDSLRLTVGDTLTVRDVARSFES